MGVEIMDPNICISQLTSASFSPSVVCSAADPDSGNNQVSALIWVWKNKNDACNGKLQDAMYREDWGVFKACEVIQWFTSRELDGYLSPDSWWSLFISRSYLVLRASKAFYNKINLLWFFLYSALGKEEGQCCSHINASDCWAPANTQYKNCWKGPNNLHCSMLPALIKDRETGDDLVRFY